MATTEVLTAGGWTFGDPPSGWQAIPTAGMRRQEEGHFPSNIVAVADEQQEGDTLAAYIERQQAAMKVQFAEAELRFEGPSPATFPETEEVLELIIHLAPPKETPVVLRQLYTRRDKQISVICMTTSEAEASSVKPVFEAILRTMKSAG